MLGKRLFDSLAIFVIGDSVLSILRPRRHLSPWLTGPDWYEKLSAPLVRRPLLVRALGVAGFALGLWLAAREEASAENELKRNRPSLHRAESDR